MARKPAAGLPDVFAKPGSAPGRGTAIEDLPPHPEPQPIPEPPPPPEPPAPEVQAAPEPPPEPPTQPDSDIWVDSDAPTAPAPTGSSTRRALIVAIVAIVVAVTAPYWETVLLSMLGLRTPVERMAEENALAITLQEQRAADIDQRLASAVALVARLQSELVAANQRAEQAAALTSTIALVRLSDTLRRPIPFAAELSVMRASGATLGDMKPLLDRIEPYAGTGIPGEAQLQRDFAGLASQVARGERGLVPTDWVNDLAIWTHLRGPAPAPTAGSPPADPSLELLRVAGARMAEGDLAGAVVQVRQLSDTYKPLFASWLEDAQARVAAETLADRVSDMVGKTLRSAKPK